jgi:hypothetical protein
MTFLRSFFLWGSLALLAACSGGREQFGLTQSTPDEFAVAPQSRLIIPPDLALRPPRPGAPRPQDTSQRRTAQSALFGADDASGAATTQALEEEGFSPAEARMLVAAGADRTPPDIRSQVRRETANLIAADRRLIDSVLSLGPPPGARLDPNAEQRRLRDLAASEADVATLPVPVIERRRRAPLEGLIFR